MNEFGSWTSQATRKALLACAVIWLLLVILGCGGGGGGPSSPSVKVLLSPDTAILSPNGNQTFTAVVTGTANTAVTWKIAEAPNGGTVDNSGDYMAPNGVGTFHVVATSQADQSQSATATITVQAGSSSITVK